MLNKEEQEYKNKILAETNEEAITNLLNAEYFSKHRELFLEKDLLEHICKYIKAEEPDFLPYYNKK